MMLSRRARGLVPWGMAAVVLAGTAGPAAQERPTYLVDTTADQLESADHCAPGAPCPLRSAIFLANQTGGLVTAELCASQGDPGCLSTFDRGYDKDSGKWVFHLDGELSALIIDRAGVTVDFTRTVADWSGPGDNVVVIDGGDAGLAQALVVQGHDHALSGFEVRGVFGSAAVELSGGARDIVLGPGLVVAGVRAQAGIRLRDAGTTANRIIGNWCGINGDGTHLDAVEGICLLLDRGAASNTIGGDGEAGNLFAGSSGAAVALHGPGADDQDIVGNVVGLLVDGSPGDVGGPGILVRDGGANRMVRNTLTASASSAIRIEGTSFGNVIEDNWIGYRAGAAPAEDVGNKGWGIDLRELAKGTRVEANGIRHNGAGGILVTGGQAADNLLTRNLITANEGPAIRVSGGGNGGVEPPRFSIVTLSMASGTACGGCLVEFFSDDADEAGFYEGSAVATAGLFIFEKEGGFRGPYLTATVTRSGNTSALAVSRAVPGRPTPTPPATPGPPSWRVLLPWASRADPLGRLGAG